MKTLGFHSTALSLALGLGLIAAAPIIAAEPASDPTPRFKKFDKDGNGQVARSEFLANRKNQQARTRAEGAFKRMDRDGSGALTPDEFPPKRRQDGDVSTATKPDVPAPES